MEISLITLGGRSARKHVSAEEMLGHYLARIGHYTHCSIENYPSEEKFFAAMDRPIGKAAGGKGFSRIGIRPLLVLLDSRGQSLSTEKFAAWLARKRDQATRHIVFAVGPADGWSAGAVERGRTSPNMLLSLGPMTLPHGLAAVILAEQIYRAFTIVEGHPYHLGHAKG